MSTTSANTAGYNEIEREGGRILGFYGVLLSNLASFGILFFWITGATHLLANNGGLINQIALSGLELALYWSFPLVVLLSLIAWMLYLAKLDLPALAVAAAPVGLAVLYYLWLVLVRSG